MRRAQGFCAPRFQERRARSAPFADIREKRGAYETCT
jgi:hypothetical protein